MLYLTYFHFFYTIKHIWGEIMKKYAYATTYKPRRNKKKKWLTIIFVLLILTAVIVGVLLWKQNTGKNTGSTYTKTYSQTKDQTKLLLKGDVKKYVDKLESKDDMVNVGNPDLIQTVNTFANNEFKQLYLNYFKGKNVELVKIDTIKKSYQPKGVTYVDAFFKSSDLGDFKMCYTWKDKKFNLYIDATKSKNEQFKKDCQQKINPLINKDNFIAPNLKFEQSASKMFYYSGEEGEEKTELGKRIYKTTKLAKVVSFNLGEKVYDSENGIFTRKISLCARDLKRNKLVVVEQSVIDCYDFYVPQDDAKVISDDGVTWTLRDQLLKMF